MKPLKEGCDVSQTFHLITQILQLGCPDIAYFSYPVTLKKNYSYYTS